MFINQSRFIIVDRLFNFETPENHSKLRDTTSARIQTGDYKHLFHSGDFVPILLGSQSVINIDKHIFGQSVILRSNN